MTNKVFKEVYGLTFNALNKLVSEEAKKIKTNATNSELENLDFSRLDTKDKNMCVYGQMTGDCFNDRATKLIKKSCEQVFHAVYHTPILEGKINGSPKRKLRKSFWSPIEIFIDQPTNKKNGNNKRLIEYLKGKTEKLILK